MDTIGLCFCNSDTGIIRPNTWYYVKLALNNEEHGSPLGNDVSTVAAQTTAVQNTLYK